MRALQWYLYEDDLKAGDTGEAAIIAAKNEELVHQQNISVSFHSVSVNASDDVLTRIMKKSTRELLLHE